MQTLQIISRGDWSLTLGTVQLYLAYVDVKFLTDDKLRTSFKFTRTVSLGRDDR